MARKSLRPYLNQIRAWTRQGRTDAWVAHQLEVSVQDVEEFKRQNGLAGGVDADTLPDPDGEEIDLRAADEALIAAELEAAALASAQASAAADEDQNDDQDGEGEGATSESASTRARRGRGRRGGSGRRSSAQAPGPMEGTFDHGEEGYGLWLDPAICDDPIYAEHWAGHRPIQVVIQEDQIVIRRLGDEGSITGAPEENVSVEDES